MKHQDLSVLLAETSADLLERPLEDFAAFLRSPEKLDFRHLEVVDHALRHTLLRLLGRAAEEAELDAAYDALRTLVPIERKAELEPWVGRWRAFADLVDSRLAVLASQDPAAACRFAHAEEILDLVSNATAPMGQAEIGVRLGLKPANLSRILGVLEANELIERRSVGREKRVSLGRLATEPAAREAATPAAEEVMRPILYLSRTR